MKLRFQRHGRQFFFFTFCVEGRRPLLSRICKGRGSTPVPPGAPEALAPTVAPAAAGGAGGGAPSPLHGGGNAEAHTELLPAGEPVLEWLRGLHGRHPALVASDRVVMPDHVHFVLIADFDRDPGFQPLSFAHRFLEETGCPAAGDGEGLWEPAFWVALSFSSRQLSAIRRYIRQNPARALWKREHPDRFVRHGGFRHSILDPAFPWSACGDLTLLGSPFLFPVRLTRRIPVEAQEAAIAETIERARLGMVPVCGFLSPAEKEVQRRLRLEPRARWIKMVPHGLPPRFDPSVEDSRVFAEGRMLILSSFPPEIPASPISRANCELMNARILRLCGPAAEPVDTSAKDGGLRPPRPLAAAGTIAATWGTNSPSMGARAAAGGAGAEPPSFEKSFQP